MVKGADSVCIDTGEERYPCPDVCSTTVIEAGMAAGIPLSLVCPLSGVCETAWLYAAAEQENGKEDGPDCTAISAAKSDSIVLRYTAPRPPFAALKIGRASCRERV